MKTTKENKIKEFRKWYKDNAKPMIAWGVPLEKIEGKLSELLKSGRRELLEKIREIEKDALAIGLTKQGRQIIDRFNQLLK